MSKETKILKKAWALLDAKERRNAIKVLVLMVVGAFASATMVGSVFPFLSVLSNPNLIHENSALKWFYEFGGFDTDYSFIVALGLGAIVVITFSNLILILQTWVVAHYTQMRSHSISRRLLAHYLAQPYEFFLGRHSGDMSTNILAEAQQVVGQFLRPLANLISSMLTVLAVVGALLIVEPVIASVTIGAFMAIYAGVIFLTRRHVVRMGKIRACSNQGRFRIANEALSGIKDLKLLGCEAVYLDRFSRSSLGMVQAQTGIAILAQIPRFAIQMVAFGGIIVLVLVLLDPASLHQREALSGILPLIGLLAFAGQRVMPELQKLYQSITMMASGTEAIERVYGDFLAGNDEPLDRSRHATLGLRKELKLNKIKYTYPGSERPSLAGVSMTIKTGERIGIIGASGAGKTTIADVILGLLHPQSGSIHIDGTEITQKNLRSWQKTVGYVPQDIFLIDASLSQNIALGLNPDEIDVDKVERAARIAKIHDLAVSELPDGYETLSGERGVRLSGGQRQRIGIARALYHDADLIVFDEATSALDNLTERDVMNAIEALPGEKTILMIAHRLSTVKICDRIVVMERGQVESIGTWDDLVASSAVFRALSKVA